MRSFFMVLKGLDYGDLYLIHTVINEIPGYFRIADARGNVLLLDDEGLEDPSSKIVQVYGLVRDKTGTPHFVAESEGGLVLLQQCSGFPPKEFNNEERHRRHMGPLYKGDLDNDNH